MLHQLRREVQATQEQAEAEMVLAHEHDFGFMLGEATFLRGWALAEQGQGEAGIAQMRQGLAAWQALGAELFRPYYLALLAEAYGKRGQSEEGSASWPRPWLSSTRGGNVDGRQSCIGSMRSSRSASEQRRRGELEITPSAPMPQSSNAPFVLRRKPSRGPLRSLAGSRPSPGSCGQ